MSPPVTRPDRASGRYPLSRPRTEPGGRGRGGSRANADPKRAVDEHVSSPDDDGKGADADNCSAVRGAEEGSPSGADVANGHPASDRPRPATPLGVRLSSIPSGGERKMKSLSSRAAIRGVRKVLGSPRRSIQVTSQ